MGCFCSIACSTNFFLNGIRHFATKALPSYTLFFGANKTKLPLSSAGRRGRLIPRRAASPRRFGDGMAKGRLQQAIGNLASNAVAYGDTSLPITVSCHIEEESVLLSVHNHGAPIPESASSALFEPMVRGVSESGDLRSIGLGLFIVREIVAAHGGTVSLESTADTGTVFSLKLPRH